MNILQIKYLLAICLLPILQPIQVFTQNQISHHFISNGEVKQASCDFITLANRELNASENELAFSAKGGFAYGGNTYSLPSGIYFYQLRTGQLIQTKKMNLIK